MPCYDNNKNAFCYIFFLPFKLNFDDENTSHDLSPVSTILRYTTSTLVPCAEYLLFRGFVNAPVA